MRLKGFIPFIIISSLVVVFFGFFAEGIMKRTLERTGSGIWGAKVEIENLELGLSPLRARIYGLQIANKNQEFQNALEVGEMGFSILFAPLLEKKFVIEDLTGTGLAFNTPRKTSGFLPVKEKKKKKKKNVSAAEEEARWRENMSSWIENVKDRASEKIDVDSYFSRDDLESFQKLEEAKEELKKVESEFSGFDKSEAEKVFSLLKESLAGVEKININNPADFPAALKQLAELRDAATEAEDYLKESRNKLKEVESSVSQVKQKILQADSARKSDMDKLMDKMKLPSIESKDIASVLFGELLVNRVNRVFDLITTVRAYIPPQEKKVKSPPRPRQRGVDIHFPKDKEYPSLLIKEVLITGSSGEVLKVDWLTNAPWMFGRPVEIFIKYAEFEASASFDRSSEETLDRLAIKASNFHLVGASGELNFNGEFKGGDIDSSLSWAGRGLLPEDWLEFLKMDDPMIEVKARVKGKILSPGFSLSSNLDTIISSHFKKELEDKISEAKRSARELISQEVDHVLSEVLLATDKFRRNAEEELQELISKVERDKEELLAYVDARRAEIDERTDKYKKETEGKLEELRGGVEESIRSLFK
ncbi:MAG: TIGR03545 family protein [Elusimicrobia bacterium]|nr:TIGR03545 family protein [Elusimicrobiota bacterium]